MKKARLLILPLGAILALVLAGCGTGNVAAGPPVVETAVVARGQLQNSASVSGKLAPVQSADMFTLAPGEVTAVNVNVGSTVSAGEVLLTVDSAAQAAALVQAKAGVGTAESAVVAAQAAVATAQASENTDQINFETAKSNYLRGQALVAQGAISQSEFDNTYQLPYQLADAKVSQVDPAALAQAQAGASQAQAALKADEAGVQAAQAAYDNTIMTAPFDGVIVARNIDPGGMSAGPPALPGETPLLVEVQLNPIYATVNVPEDQINGLAVGQKAQVNVTGASDQTLTGTISHVALAANPSAATAYLVEVTLPNPGGTLKPGMFASVTFNDNTTGYLLVPNQAVVQQGATSTVWVVQNGTAEARNVQLGATDGQNTIVDSGLAVGDQVITSGQQGLTAGEKVTVKSS